VVVLGHPSFYPRFGFVFATAKGINCEFDVPEEAWMVAELRAGALDGKAGTVRFQPELLEAQSEKPSESEESPQQIIRYSH